MASRGLRGLMAIGGGALAGIGQGLVSAGEEKRAAALEALRHQRELERDDRRFEQQRNLAAEDRKFRGAEAETDRNWRSGQAEADRAFKEKESQADRIFRDRIGADERSFKRAEAAADRKWRSGEAELDRAAKQKASTGEFTPADKRLWDTVIARHTSGKGTLEGESTDWDSAAAEFAQRGRNDLARLAVPEPPAGGSARVDVNSAEWREAVRQAEAEASGRTGLFTTRGSEFPETNGNMEAWVNQRAMELYRSFRGQPAAPDGGSGQKTSEGRPIVDNGDGSISTERTITITDERINGGRPTNIPSMFGGKQVSEQEAIERIVRAGGKDPETGRALPAYETIDDAVRAAQERSEGLGRQYGGGGSMPSPPAPRNPAQRKVGQVYATPDGRKVQWMGNGWKLVE